MISTLKNRPNDRSYVRNLADDLRQDCPKQKKSQVLKICSSSYKRPRVIFLYSCFAFKMISSRIKFISKLPLQVQKVELKFPSHSLLLSLDECAEQKSDNLQYNTLVYMADGTMTKCLTFQVFIFIIHYRLNQGTQNS